MANLRPMKGARALPCFLAAGLVAAALAAGPAPAQGIASNAEEARAGEEIRGDTRVVDIDEIERGFYLSVDYGPNYYIPIEQPGFVTLNPDYLRPGTRMGIRAGYDLLNNVKLDLFVLANFNEGLIDGSAAQAGQLSGDLAHFAPGAALRFDYITTDDQRFFAFARVGVGYAFWFPKQLAQDQAGSIHTDASLGVEYYTKLRHLSVGLEADFQALIAPFAFGISVYPTLKYTF
jgi:hypothetical protein